MSKSLYFQALEVENIHIFREVAAGFYRPVMLYSIGKDSSIFEKVTSAMVEVTFCSLCNQNICGCAQGWASFYKLARPLFVFYPPSVHKDHL